MMKRFEDALDALSYEELLRVKSDIDSHGFSTKRALEEKIKKKMSEHQKSCTVCSSALRFYNASNYTLIFGPDDFKKKASFCGLDCLEYFMGHLKQIKSQKNETTMGNEKKESGQVI